MIYTPDTTILRTITARSRPLTQRLAGPRCAGAVPCRATGSRSRGWLFESWGGRVSMVSLLCGPVGERVRSGMLVLVNPRYTSFIFNRLQIRAGQRAFLGEHYPLRRG